jgi:hypothetical protein
MKELVKITPIEFQLRTAEKGKHPRIIVYRNIQFSRRLDQDILNKVTHHLVTQEKIETGVSESFLTWYYFGKPEMWIDTINNELLAIPSIGFRFANYEYCQQQATILLKVLKKFYLARYRTCSITYNPDKMGRTSEELEESLKVIRYISKILYPKFRTCCITYDPDKMGRTSEDLEKTFAALRKLREMFYNKNRK